MFKDIHSGRLLKLFTNEESKRGRCSSKVNECVVHVTRKRIFFLRKGRETHIFFTSCCEKIKRITNGKISRKSVGICVIYNSERENDGPLCEIR